MRIIAGRFRGRRLIAAAGLTTRPMPDRVKQAIFDILGARWAMPGELPPVAVLDIFAGTGPLGLEALSRGARFCCFVEQDDRATRLLRNHLAELQVADAAVVVMTDAFSNLPVPRVASGYALVFVDPPYRTSRDSSATGPVGTLLERLTAEAGLSQDAVVLLRHEQRCSYDSIQYGRLRAFDRREYGRMAVTFLSPVT
jgi:16S rRNA (guanine966-N2)-methyltransferase